MTDNSKRGDSLREDAVRIGVTAVIVLIVMTGAWLVERRLNFIKKAIQIEDSAAGDAAPVLEVAPDTPSVEGGEAAVPAASEERDQEEPEEE